MSGTVLDEIDERIVYELQRDARNSTTTALADELDVTATTVSNRISQLERDGIVTGYHATVDYGQAGFPLHVLLVCTAPISERATLAEQALEIPGVVTVRELMLGTENLRVEAVGRTNDDITRVATALDELGLQPSEEILVRNHYTRPLPFRTDDESYQADER